jgi:hypothetical protein
LLDLPSAASAAVSRYKELHREKDLRGTRSHERVHLDGSAGAILWSVSERDRLDGTPST